MDRIREQIIAFNRAWLDSWLIVGNSAISAAQHLTALNADTWRQMIEVGADEGKAMLEARDMKTMAARAVEIKPYFDRMASYASNAYDIALSSAEGMNDALETRIAAWQAQANEAVQEAAAEMPAAAVPGGATLLTAAAGMSDWLHRTVKQLIDFARGRNNVRNLPISRPVETSLVPVRSGEEKAQARMEEPPVVDVFPDPQETQPRT